MNLKTKGIILRRTNYGEADRIINFLTPKGQVDVIARGVRREKSRLSGGLELLSVCEIVIYKRDNEQLGIVTSARLLKFYENILKNYLRLNFIYESMKIIGRASQFLEEDAWYCFLEKILNLTNNLTVDLRVVKIWFFLGYADLMGHGLNLTFSVDQEKLVADKKYYYDSNEKGLRASTQGKIKPEHIKLLRLLKGGNGEIQVATNSAWVLDDCLELAREHAAIF